MIVDTTRKLELSASHQRKVSHEHSETLAFWRGNAPQVQIASRSALAEGEAVSISGQARQALRVQADEASPLAKSAAETENTGEEDKALDEDPKLTVIRRMLEILTGHDIQLFSAEAPPQGESAEAAAGAAANEAAVPPPAPDWGARYESHEVYEERESASFAASGVVQTADGRSISFSLKLSMESSLRIERSQVELFGNAPKDPLVINFAGTAAQLSDQQFRFDLDGDGRSEDMPMLGAGSGYLVFDRNGDGRVNSGKELFGPASNNGFNELAALDSDGNGWIDEADADFDRLGVWRGTPDGPAPTLTSLREAGIGALAVAHLATPLTLRGAAGNVLGNLRDTGVALTESGRALALQQIDVVAG